MSGRPRRGPDERRFAGPGFGLSRPAGRQFEIDRGLPGESWPERRPGKHHGCRDQPSFDDQPSDDRPWAPHGRDISA